PELLVDQELDALDGVEAVVLGGERLVVSGVHVLHHRPRRPAGRETALGAAGRDDLLRVRFHVRPRLRRLLGIEPRLLGSLPAVIEDTPRAVLPPPLPLS